MNDNEKSKSKTLLWMLKEIRKNLVAAEFLAKEISAPAEGVDQIKASLNACEAAGKIAEDFNDKQVA